MTSRAELVRLARSLAVRLRLWRCASVGEGVRVLGRVHVHGAGVIRIGSRVTLDSARLPIELHAARGGTIVIEDDVYVGGGTSIEACESVRIGPRTRLEGLCKVMDNHFHHVHGDRAAVPPSCPVVVDADVTIGARAILLPGARIGRGGTVGSASVVSRIVAPGGRVAGVPATAKEAPP